MRGKAMPKRVWRGKLNNTRQLNRFFNRALHGFFIRMMAAYHVVRTLFNLLFPSGISRNLPFTGLVGA